MPLTHDNVVSIKLVGNRLILTTWSDRPDPWMLSPQGSLHPNTYEFDGRVVIRRLELSPGDAEMQAELKRRLVSGETVNLVAAGKRPRVEVEYEYRDGVFIVDIAVKWV